MSPAPKHSYEEERTLIMAAAVHCVETSSISDFTMSALAKAAGLSMGSVYKHIRSKEDVIVALAIDHLHHLAEIFDKVLALPLPFPVRLIALQLVDRNKIHHYSFGPELDALISSETFLRRASPERMEILVDADIALEEKIRSALEQSIEAGELDLDKKRFDTVAEELMVASWSMCVGFAQVARQMGARRLVGKGTVKPSVLPVDDISVRSLQHLLNSYPWSKPVDDQAIRIAGDKLIELALR